MVFGSNPGTTGRRSGRTRRQFLARLGVAVGAGVVGFGAASEPAVADSHTDESAFSTERVEISSHDDTTIVGTLYEPDSEGPHPAILMTHGWGGQRQDREPLASMYASNDYVVLAYDSRGFGESGGQVTSTGPNEQKDAQALITWLAGREAVQTDGEDDPRIGMDGFSYGGGIQLRTASVDDRLDALVPRITWHDLAQSLAPNGVLKVGWQLPLRLSGAQNGNLAPETTRIGEEIAELGTMTEEHVEYYQSRSAVTFGDDIDTPALFISGWQDRLFPANEAIANFETLRSNDVDARLLMHDTGHNFFGPQQTETEQEFIAEAALSWMAYHLRGGEEPDLATVSYFDAQRGEFQTAESMPPADATERTVHLGDQGGRGAWVLRRGKGEPGSEQFARQDFDIPVEGRQEVVGIPTLRAFVGAFGGSDPRARVMAALVDVGPDGEAETIDRQVMPLEVTERGAVELDLVGTQHVVEEGHDLRLSLTLVDDLLTSHPADYVDTALYVDTEPVTTAIVSGTPQRPATLTVPMRDL